VSQEPLRRTWLVECYSPGIERDAVARAGERAREAALGLRRDGHVVDYLGALLVPDDEVVFHAFASESDALVGDVSRSAGLRYERVVESVTVSALGSPDALDALISPLGPRDGSATSGGIDTA
jgi:hypothetical protein